MLHQLFVLFWRYGRAGEYELTVFSSMVYFKSHGVPYFGGYLPFVDKAWCGSRQNVIHVGVYHLKILGAPKWVVHIYYAA